jgi:CHAD domain-containing protein
MSDPSSLTLAVPPAAAAALRRHPAFGGQRGGTARRCIAWHDTAEGQLHRNDIVLCIAGAGAQRRRLVRVGERWIDGRPLEAAEEGFDVDALPRGPWRTRLARAAAKGLLALFEVDCRVRSWRLPAAGGELSAQFAQGELRCGGRSEAVSELMLTAPPAAQCALWRLARALASDLPLALAPAGVEARGYALALGPGTTPFRAGPSPLEPDDDPAQALRRIAATCVAHFSANAGGARADPEYVHQMRVALRRLRSALRAFAPLLGQALPERHGDGLRRLGSALGAARDWDVLHSELLQPVLAGRPGDARIAQLAQAVERRRDRAHAEAAATLAADRHDALFIDLMAWLHCDWQLPPEAPALKPFSAARLEALHRRVAKAARRASAQDIATLHRLRIAIKRMRYAAEFFAPLYPRKAVQAYLRRMADLQQDLGMLNDLANAGPALAKCAEEEPQTAEGVAFVQGWHAPRLAALLQRMPDEIAALRRQERFWRAPPKRSR